MSTDSDVDRFAPPGPGWLEQGRAAFNRAAFFDAHECWENAWRGLKGQERTVVQGLIQIAAGLHHLQQHRSVPAGRLLAKGLEKLARGAPTRLGGMRFDALIADVERFLKKLAAAEGALPTPDSLTLGAD